MEKGLDYLHETRRLKRRGIVVWLVAIAAVIAILLFFWLRGAEVVASGPPIAAADNYFSKLKLRQTDGALGFYSEDFRAKGTLWPQLLSGLQENYGPVIKATLKGASVVPVSGVGCTLLLYQVQREKLLSEEKLIFCP